MLQGLQLLKVMLSLNPDFKPCFLDMKRFPGFVCGVLIYFQLLLVLVGASTFFGKFFSKKFVLDIVGPLLVCIPGLRMATGS